VEDFPGKMRVLLGAMLPCAAALLKPPVLSGMPWAASASSEGRAAIAIRKYFEAWNRRDMETACDQFADECSYEDTQYAGAFTGKDALKSHLFRVADALPPTFEFCIDDVADGGDTVGVQWHVENGGVELPFTRGCSMYKADPRTGLLISGFDVPEPAPFKPGSASLALLSVASKVIAEPVRAIPAVCWLLYVSIVFFSNGILPGPDATQLDAATWDEVLGLSLNFWLVAPLLNLPFSPAIHPGLEGIFNLLLAWAAAFAGFLSDGRPGRSSGSMLPVAAGMQFLTNAFLLPYLVVRSPETETEVYADDLEPTEALISEWRGLGPLLALVGSGAVAWGVAARPEFGDLPERLASLQALLAGDRLGTSFVVDLILFGFFQGWLVDDDLKRRGVKEGEAGALRALAKFVPFYGMCAYLTLRPAFPSRDE
jgi:ketosteroid isomerase-like protein